MSKINTKTVRDKTVAIMSDLRGIVALYVSGEEKVAVVEENSMLSREYKDLQIRAIRHHLP